MSRGVGGGKGPSRDSDEYGSFSGSRSDAALVFRSNDKLGYVLTRSNPFGGISVTRKIKEKEGIKGTNVEEKEGTKGTNVTITFREEVEAKDLVDEIPEGATVEFEEGQKVDMNSTGAQEVTVIVKVGEEVKKITVIVMVNVEDGKLTVKEKKEDVKREEKIDTFKDVKVREEIELRKKFVITYFRSKEVFNRKDITGELAKKIPSTKTLAEILAKICYYMKIKGSLIVKEPTKAEIDEIENLLLAQLNSFSKVVSSDKINPDGIAESSDKINPDGIAERADVQRAWEILQDLSCHGDCVTGLKDENFWFCGPNGVVCMLVTGAGKLCIFPFGHGARLLLLDIKYGEK